MQIKTKQIMLLALVASLFTLSGCFNEKKEEKKETFKTVAYYEKNKTIRESRIKECASMEEMTKITAIDCENAKRADSKGGTTSDTTGFFK